jgi:serine palmitoyltransferase
LDIENRIAAFMGAEECILYSDAIASISSVIPAFAKKGDVIVVDSSASFAIQQGCLLSRSDIYYFKHGDVKSLEDALKQVDAKEKSKKVKKSGPPLHRKFIVLEAVSSIDGSIAPLPQIVALKDKYKYRLILDDSFGFGTLGANGRGSLEHHGLTMKNVDALCAAMDGSLASVGGFCCGSHQVVDHQRLSGAGYCFSASSPPYTSTASILALEMMESNSQLGADLRVRAQKMRRNLGAIKGLKVLGGPESEFSPVIHVALAGAGSVESELEGVESIHRALLEQGIVTTVPEFIPADKAVRQPTLRIMMSVLHTEADLDKLLKAIAQAARAL